MGVGSFLKAAAVKLHTFAMTLGAPGLFFLAMADSSFISIPEANDILIVILSIRQSWSTMFYYVGLTTLGSVIGCFMLYSVGRRGGEIMLRKKFSEQKIAFARRMFAKSDILMVLIPCLMPPPMPFKIFVLSSGVFGLKPTRFILAVFLGRMIRYSMWGILAVLYGEPVEYFLEHNIYKVGIVLMIVFVVAFIGFVAFHVWLYRRSQKLAATVSNSGEYIIGGKR